MQGKRVDSGATRPNSTFNRRKVMRGRLAWVCGCKEDGHAHLSPNYVCGATYAPIRMAPLTRQSVTHRQSAALAMPTGASRELSS